MPTVREYEAALQRNPADFVLPLPGIAELLKGLA